MHTSSRTAGRPAAIRVVKQKRDGQNPEGVTVSVEVLKPLTSAEKRAGRSDRYSQWIRTYGGNPGRKSARGRHPSDWWEQKPKREKRHANIDEAVQLEIAKVMARDFERMANKLVSQSHISVSDKEFFKGLMFDACRDAYPKFSPDRRSLRGFMKDILKKWRSDYLDFLNSGKRKEDFTRLSIRNRSVSEESLHENGSETAPDGGISTATVCEEEIPHPRSHKELEFNLSWSDLEDMCDPDERLALHILYRGGTVEDVASRLKLNPASARRNVVGTLQLKVDFCFAFSGQRHLKFILGNR